MAPRIRLNIAKPLPTISEALEDILDDITSNTKGFGNACTSPDSSSGEDYLQSICQLARPTFPVLPESQRKVQDTEKLGMLHNSHRVFSLSETPKMVSRYKITDILPNARTFERNSSILDRIKTYSSSKVDPLEELYTEAERTHRWRYPNGSENTDHSQHNFQGISVSEPREKAMEKPGAVSFPRLPSPRPMQRENSCPELKSLRNQGKMPALESSPYQKETDPLIVNGKSIWLHPPRETPPDTKILRYSQRGQQTLKAAAFPEREQQPKPSIYDHNVKGEVSKRAGCVGYFHVDKRNTSCDWISEYQSAWKEAKVRACLLPAIAES
ncbi:uncharacterized protein LOC128407929 [Podarcis raffonei]|uniref:uncharacterized protein LOC128407929 n=1 Tax=Podarcis raffonei TaxID=65483 RepID=UPI00232963F4|nr:uncharacterized protein LOC128407929 [Podarcis raffonei]